MISRASSSRSKRVAGRRERDAELGVLLVEPRGAERQLEPAVRRVVDRERLRGEHRRVPVGHAGDEQAEPDARGLPGQRGERGHAVEGLARALAVHRLEVVEAPGAVEAELLGELHPADHLVPGHPLLCDIESEAHGEQPTGSRAEADRGPGGLSDTGTGGRIGALPFVFF